MRRLAAAAVLVLLLTGCSASDDPPSVITTDRPDPSESARTPVPGLAFGGGTGGTVPGCRPDRTYLAAYQSVEVTREVRLGEVTVVGGGRLVGEVWLLPAPRRGASSQGVTSIGNRPSLDLARAREGWARRVPVRGRLVRPGDYAVVLQLEARPGRDIDGVAFAWSAGAATGSDQLDLSLRYARRCAR